MLTAPSLADYTPVATGRVIMNQTLAQLQAVFGAGNVKTPTRSFSLHYNGHTLSCTKGVPFVVDAPLAAALTAASAPVA